MQDWYKSSKYYKLGQNYYKSGQFQLLQIGTVLVITNWGKIFTNWNSYYKLRIGAEHQLQLIRIIFQVFEQWKIYQNSQDIPVMESFRNKIPSYLAISLKIIPYHVFPWEILINFQSKFFVVHLWLAASDHLSWSFNLK